MLALISCAVGWVVSHRADPKHFYCSKGSVEVGEALSIRCKTQWLLYVKYLDVALGALV